MGDDLYFVSDGGVASCVNAKTGEMHWIEQLTGSYSASPVYVNESVLILSQTGLATWVQAGCKFTALGSSKVPGCTLATPAFSGGAMYLRTDEHFYKIARQLHATIFRGARFLKARGEVQRPRGA